MSISRVLGGVRYGAWEAEAQEEGEQEEEEEEDLFVFNDTRDIFHTLSHLLAPLSRFFCA